jgi:hypothetical protein
VPAFRQEPKSLGGAWWSRVFSRFRVRHQALRTSRRWASLNWDLPAGVRRPWSRKVQVGLRWSQRSGSSKLAVRIWFSGGRCHGMLQRSVRGMNDPGKTHPAGEARWARARRHRVSGAPEHLGSDLAEAGRANDPVTRARSVQRELRGRDPGGPHWDDDAAGAVATAPAGSVTSSSDRGTFNVHHRQLTTGALLSGLILNNQRLLHKPWHEYHHLKSYW